MIRTDERKDNGRETDKRKDDDSAADRQIEQRRLEGMGIRRILTRLSPLVMTMERLQVHFRVEYHLIGMLP